MTTGRTKAEYELLTRLEREAFYEVAESMGLIKRNQDETRE